jgi:hypothetical protein
MKKEAENRHMYNKGDAQLDALIIQTMDQDFDFYDEDYDNVDKEMHLYHLHVIHF